MAAIGISYIILDYLTTERERHLFAQRVFEMAVNDELACSISPISLINLFYILRKQRNEQERKDMIENLIDIFNITPLDDDVLQMGLFVPIADYEDGIQYICAKGADVDFILSNDKHFGNSQLDIEVVSPEVFLKMIQE